MDNNIPELKKNIWKLVEACAKLSNRSATAIVREFTTSQSFPNGKLFEELKSKWNLCSFRAKIDKYYHEYLDHNIFKWYREGLIERNPPEQVPDYSKFVSTVGEGTPPDTWGT